jgi:hypothetical protein
MGWHWYLEKFDAEVSGRPAPGDWESFFAQVGPGYGRGSAPAAPLWVPLALRACCRTPRVRECSRSGRRLRGMTYVADHQGLPT